MIEAHHWLHTAFILVCYVLGQWAGILGAAYAGSKSTLNSIKSIRQWFAVRWVPVGIRALMSLFAFFVIWENPSLFNLEKFMPNFAAHMGVAGFVGFASDQLIDKVLVVLFPNVQKELPVIPNGGK